MLVLHAVPQARKDLTGVGFNQQQAVAFTDNFPTRSEVLQGWVHLHGCHCLRLHGCGCMDMSYRNEEI